MLKNLKLKCISPLLDFMFTNYDTGGVTEESDFIDCTQVEQNL